MFRKPLPRNSLKAVIGILPACPLGLLLDQARIDFLSQQSAGFFSTLTGES
jgi:hypothetical protein